jgi:hypothetical protein
MDPGVQNGNKVRQQYTVPISFTLTDQPKNNIDEKYSLLSSSKASAATAGLNRKDTAHTRNINPSNAGAYSYSNSTLPILERAAADTGRNDIKAYMTSNVGNTQGFFVDTKVSEVVKSQKNAAKSTSPVNALKDKAASNIFGQKATNGVVLMITKHKPFYDQDGLDN